MKKLLLLLVALIGGPILLQGFDFTDIDSIMEENSFRNVTSRYNSILAYFFPEATTRLGMTLGNKQLNTRTAERMNGAISSLTPILGETTDINATKLQPAKAIDYQLFLANLSGLQNQLRQDNWLKNPLYYAAAFDAIYDLNLRVNDNPRQRLNDIRARLSQLPQVAEQAAQNLKNPPPLLAKLAMEKAYYAFLAFEAIQTQLEATAIDAFAKQDMVQELRTYKNAIRALFEQFKTLSQQEAQTDYRLGNAAYKNYLKNVYQIDMDSDKLSRLLEENYEQAQKKLFDALAPFELSADDSIVMLNDFDGSVVVMDEATTDEDAAQTEKPKKEKKSKKDKKQKREFIPPTAAQYFALAKNFNTPQEGADVLTLLAAESDLISSTLVNANLIPEPITPVSLQSLPAYQAYMEPYVFITADGIDSFFVREPNGNSLNQQEMLARDFNEPMRKVFISRQLIPGRLYQYNQTRNLSKDRRLYASPTLQNGWSAFAQRLAEKGNVFVEDEELLTAAYAEYEQAVKALVDFKLNTREFTYADATQYLMESNGFTQEQAEEILREIVLKPAQNVSTVVGLNTFEKVYKKYAKKVGKKFSHADLIGLFLQVGNVLPSQLEGEVTRLYNETRK